ncbi:MAG: hypothetical protein IJ279_06425 [Clostridia bacterium]|nr:hypothetical protein [Clostridia bacterium]
MKKLKSKKKQQIKGEKPMFCERCGKEIDNDSFACKHCGGIVSEKSPIQNKNMKSPKKRLSLKIIVPVVAVVLILAIIFFIAVKNYKKNEDLEILEAILRESTEKPIADFVYEDYDSDGTYEVFAVVGESAIKDKRTEYSDADIYFVNHTEAQLIKESVCGYFNGVIETDDRIYVSLEVYEDEADKGFSYIYSADAEFPVESDISGKYSEVHEEKGKIIVKDASCNFIEIEIPEKVNMISKYLVATDEDKKNFNDFVSSASNCFYNNFDSDASDAIEQAYGFINAHHGSEIYRFFFDRDSYKSYDLYTFPDDEKKLKSILNEADPLNRFGEAHFIYAKYPAQNIDWIIKNIFGLTPDRSISSADNEPQHGYYYEGDFYMNGGEGIPYTVTFETKFNQLPDGRYKATTIGTGEESELFCTINSIVGLRDIGGKRVWTISKTTCTYPEEETETTTESNTTELNSENLSNVVKYLGGPISEVFKDYGEDYESVSFEGGHQAGYYNGSVYFGKNDWEDFNENASNTVTHIIAIDNVHLCGDFYSDMSYNDLKKVLPDLKFSSGGEYCDHYISFEYENYSFSYFWYEEGSDEDTICSEVWVYA